MWLIVFVIVIVIVIFMIKGALDNEKNASPTVCRANKSVQPNAVCHKDTWTNLDVEVVGGFYRSYEAKRFIKELSIGDNVYFLPEPSNPYDRNAVMVISSTGLHIGYIKREWAEEVNMELKKRGVRGWVCDDVESTYEFEITIDKFCDVEERDKALFLYTDKNNVRKKIVNEQQKRESLGYFDIIYKVDTWYDMKQYDRVEDAIKPFFEANVQDSKCYELMIQICHVLKKYEEEEKLIDEYLVVNEYADKSYWKRRKFHILRVMGIIVSDEQIENEKVGIETTVIELDAFNIVVDLLSNDVDSNRIDFRDAQSLFAINLDGNTRKPICKLYLNKPAKMSIGLIGVNKSITKKPLNTLDDIKLYSDQLEDTVQRYFNETSFSEF